MFADPTLPSSDPPPWPGTDRPTVVLIDVSSRLEHAIIERWVEAARRGPVDIVALVRSRRRPPNDRIDRLLATRLSRSDNPVVFAVRIVWLAPERKGNRTARWIDVLKLGDPRYPGFVRQRAILSRFPERVRLVAGAPAFATDLVRAHSDSVETRPLGRFVTRRAHRSLDQAERRLRGNRYKVPKLVHEEILASDDFRSGVLRIGSETGMPPEPALARARYYLREMAASHSSFLIDVIANAIHWLYRQGYGAIIYDRDNLSAIAALAESHPIAFVPSHRSNLDRLSLQYLLWENDLPPNHTAAGINMNFFPIGPLIRRTGGFFIRRSFRDKPLYKFVLRSYLGYLIERRFTLEWYMEGGRSRSGKLLPPKLGMLSWVVEALQRGKADEFYFIPTSIAYDQIQDVGSYAAEAQGKDKEKESLAWVYRSIRALRQRYGNIHVRFAQPIAASKVLGAEFGTDDNRLEKLAFEIMYRIGQVTPITPTALVSIALLWEGGTPSILDQLVSRALALDTYVTLKGFPTTEVLDLEEPTAVLRVLNQLESHGSVDGTGGLYRLSESQALQAAYYRNAIVHFFVPGAIAEMALLAADGSADQVLGWAERFRDLLKFEFFFADHERFQLEIESELMLMSKDWARAGSVATLTAAPLLRAHWALLPFLQAYQVVADRLVEVDRMEDPKAFVRTCLELGKRRTASGEISAADAVSQVLFASALELAANRNLLESGSDRSGFADEIAIARRLAERIGKLR